MKETIEKALQEGLKENNLVNLRFSAQRYHHLIEADSQDEIEFDGHRYDVAEVIFNKDSVQVKCLADHKEDNIKKYMAGRQQQKHLQVEKSFSNLYSLHNPIAYTQSGFIIQSFCYFHLPNSKAKLMPLEIPTPPPAG